MKDKFNMVSLVEVSYGSAAWERYSGEQGGGKGMGGTVTVHGALRHRYAFVLEAFDKPLESA